MNNNKFEPKWFYKSLDRLEKVNTIKTTNEGYLIPTIERLRSLPLIEFTIEDLRIMIGQGIGLKFLIPIAIERLNENLFVEGDYYEGDLLQMVLEVDESFWHDNKEKCNSVFQLINSRLEELKENNIRVDAFHKAYENCQK